jgi:hypothetical protein
VVFDAAVAAGVGDGFFLGERVGAQVVDQGVELAAQHGAVAVWCAGGGVGVHAGGGVWG